MKLFTSDQKIYQQNYKLLRSQFCPNCLSQGSAEDPIIFHYSSGAATEIWKCSKCDQLWSTDGSTTAEKVRES